MVNILGVPFGGSSVPVIAGPCSIESKEQFLGLAQELKEMKVSFLRGGIYKLRTNPESFQGLGKEAYPIAQEVSHATGLPFTSEVTDPRQIEELHEITSMFQVGTRNMYNYDLLKELGKSSKPVLLKRAFSATYGEFLNAAEYILAAGNKNVLLCERGIRTFVNDTRNTFDINAIPFLKNRTDLPVLADPSHGTGLTELVEPVALAALAAGADGLIIEVHNDPKNALSDGQQALTTEQFKSFLDKADKILNVLGRSLHERG